MDSIVLYNQNGQKFDVNVVRYFKDVNNKYLVFDLAEVDNNGYIQLYLAKEYDENGKMVLGNVADEEEWHRFRETIQTIVNNNRNNIPNDGDLDYKTLDGATVSEFRIFKLKDEVAKLFGANKNLKKPEVKPVEPVNLQSASAADTGMSIEEILKQVSDGARNARENAKVELTPKKTIEDIIKPIEPIAEPAPVEEELPKINPVPDFVVPASHEVYKEEPKFFVPFDEPVLEPKVIPSMTPVTPTDNTDYKAKYEESLTTIRKLEDENIRLINELVEAKAKIETIKDLID